MSEISILLALLEGELEKLNLDKDKKNELYKIILEEIKQRGILLD